MGIFCMIYIQEIRLWILVKNNSNSMIVSLATNRDRMDFDQYAVELQDKIKKITN
jgi:cytochrome c biogenesis protein